MIVCLIDKRNQEKGMARGDIGFYIFFLSSLVILSFLFCRSLSEGKEKLCGSPPNSRMTLLQTFFSSSLCPTNAYTSQESDSRLLLFSPHPLSSGTLGFSHRCPHSHFSNTFSITPALNYHSTYLLEMITQDISTQL